MITLRIARSGSDLTIIKAVDGPAFVSDCEFPDEKGTVFAFADGTAIRYCALRADRWEIERLSTGTGKLEISFSGEHGDTATLTADFDHRAPIVQGCDWATIRRCD